MSDNDIPQVPEEINPTSVLEAAKAMAEKIDEMAKAAKANTSSIEDLYRQITASLVDAQTKLNDIAAVTTQASAAKTQITDSQAVIATKSDHIQKAQEHADKVRGDLDRALTSAKQQATEAEGEKVRTKSAADGATELLTNVKTIKGAIDNDAAAIVAARDTAMQSATQTKTLADKAAEVEERIATYENRLKELESLSTDQLKTIEGLLPGATSAHLAHAFDERRKSFLKPMQRWQTIFVGSLAALILLAGQGIMHGFFSNTPFTYDEVLRLWLSRLPVAGALVWLAIHASREAALAKRLEEDYGYKSAVASTFLGFYKQMSEVGATAATNEPLAKLCSDTLTTIASPPGRIYDKHELTISPTKEIATLGKTAVETINEIKKLP